MRINEEINFSRAHDSFHPQKQQKRQNIHVAKKRRRRAVLAIFVHYHVNVKT